MGMSAEGIRAMPPDDQTQTDPATTGTTTTRDGVLYLADIEAERVAWYELTELVRTLTPEECLIPGYYRDPDWSVRDVAAHIGTWLAEAEVQFERMRAQTYGGHDVDIDAMNARFLAAMADQPWEVAWIQATSGRSRMVQTWAELGEPNDEAAWWIRKSAVDHYEEHLERLRVWVPEVVRRRGRAEPG